MNRLAPILLEHKTPWPTELSLRGNVQVLTSDPARSNSGQLFAAILAKTLQEQRGSVFAQTFPEIDAYLDSLGFKPPTTSELFRQCYGKGMAACPMFVAYESQLLDHLNANNVGCGNAGELQVIYPVPTMWATHPLIATTSRGEKLLEAIDDPAIRKIAVEKHGFRSALRETPPSTCFPFPDVDPMPLPSRAEMIGLLGSLTP
jgi:hypothetical protein